MWDDIEQWALRLAGIAGAVVSVRFVSGSYVHRALMVAGGAFFSFYATDWVADKLAMPAGLVGFLLGLFGMSVLSRVWEWMQQTNAIRDFLDAWLRRGPRPPDDKG